MKAIKPEFWLWLSIDLQIQANTANLPENNQVLIFKARKKKNESKAKNGTSTICYIYFNDSNCNGLFNDDANTSA